MTRPYKSLIAENEKEIMSNKESVKITPERTIKYSIYKTVIGSKNDLLLNEIRGKLKIITSRRVFEKHLTDLYNDGLISRQKCRCNCSYIYSRK